MKIWKTSLAAALLLFPSLTAMAATTTILQGQGPASYGQPYYPQYNPMNYGVGPSNAPGQSQQMIQNMVAPPPGSMIGQQQQQPTTYHYKGKSLGGAISKEEMPQRLFNNIPRNVYGSVPCMSCASGPSAFSVTITVRPVY